MKNKVRHLRPCAVEPMEPRVLLSAASVSAVNTPVFEPMLHRPVSADGVSPAGDSSPSATGGFSVDTLRDAYGVGVPGTAGLTYNISFNGVQGDGTGQTIAVVDAFNDPNIATDLATFDAAEGLPAPPAFTVVGQTGSTTSLPANDATDGGSSDWSGEESLDVEWAHAMAPGAGILVVECTSNSGTYLEQGDAIAAAYPGVSVVSNSYGGGESSSETSTDSDFTTPSSHTGVSFFASTGDTGAEVEYPAVSPNVVAVGGTQLTVSGSSWSSETTWSDAGGGISTRESQPSFQTGTITASKREVPDISMSAGQNSGSSDSYVPVCDSWSTTDGQSASDPWEGLEGTSWSCPMTAALVAIADQGRALEGLSALKTITGSNQVDTRLYQLSAANFHDITSGSNGHSAVTGYDEATGIGSPIANLLVPDLAGAGTVTGRAFVDNSGNGVYGGTDTPVAGQTVYLDLNNDGKQDNGEPSATTNSQGIYTFTDEPAGGVVRLTSAAPSGDVLVSPSSGNITYGTTDTVNFTYETATKVVITSQPANTTYGNNLNTVTATVEDPGGATMNVSSSVVLTLSSGTFTTGVSTVTVAAVDGVATFSGLKISTAGTYTLNASDGTLTPATSNSFQITQVTPNVLWSAPASITYGTALTSFQLDATANVPGTFDYSPTVGTVLGAGSGQALHVTFVPTDSVDYAIVSGSTTITVTKAAPTITWANPASITYGTALRSTQLDANASVPGTFAYNPSAGTVLSPGANQSLGVLFTPTDSSDYTTANASVLINVTGVVTQPINLTGSTFYLKLDNASPQNLDIWTNATATGSPDDVREFDTISSITLSATSAGDSFTADFSNGSIVPSGGLTFNGFGAASANALTVVGTGGSDTVTAPGDGNFNINSQTIAYSNISTGTVYFSPGGSGEALSIPSTTVNLAPGNSSGITTDVFSSIAIAAGAELATPLAAIHSQRLLIQTGALNLAGNTADWTSTLDLSNNDLDIANGDLTTITSQATQGYTIGTGGILSSAAMSDPAQLTTIGVLQNSIDGTTTGSPLYGSGTSLGLFDGTSPASSDVLLKYTYIGDANLDGTVDGSDYNRIDSASLSPAVARSPAPRWFNGDFNYDGVVNGSDYTLIDNAYNTQGASLAAQIAKVAATSASHSGARRAPVFAQSQIGSPAAADLIGGWVSQPTSVAAGIFSADDDSALSEMEKKPAA